MTTRWRGVMTVAAVARVAAGAWADEGEWTRLRGPNGQGTSACPTIPVQWTDKDYHWKTRLAGEGHSSPVVWGDRVFVTSADPETATRFLECVRAADGKVLWTRRFESKPCHLNGLNSFASQTPAVDADRVYLIWATPEEYPVVALDHDGKDVWRRDLGPFQSQHGHGGSPMLFGDLVVVPNDQKAASFLIALDAATGKTRWQVDRKVTRAAYSTPCVYRPDNGPPELIFTSTSHGVTSLDPATGKVNWEAGEVFPERVVSSPVIAGRLILGTCGTGGRGRSVVAVRAPVPGTGAPAQVAWEMKKSAPYVPTGVAVGDLVFVWAENGTVTCLRAATGETVWSQRVDGYYYASPICVAGRLYNVTTKGEVVVLAAGEEFKELARNPLGEKCQATPAVAGGRLYLRTLTHLLSLGGTP